MKSSEPITLKRDCEAVQIPSGMQVVLPQGTQVMITQSLGGSYTVMTNYGYMVRIAGKDADALGLEGTQKEASQPPTPSADLGPADVERMVWEQLKTCYDPEIPVNIVDLGLVYHCEVIPLSEGGYRVEVKFTLTAPGCGMGDWLKADIESKLFTIPGVEDVEVEVVFDPPWDQSMMSEAAKLQLGLM